jgi:hypothetical protein
MNGNPNLLTTGAAASIIGVTDRAVRGFIESGQLVGEREGAHWYLRRDLVEAFAASRIGQRKRTRRACPAPRTAWDALEVVNELHECNAGELAEALDRHEGNARKYLVILRRRGFVESINGVHRITPAGRDHLVKEARIAS